MLKFACLILLASVASATLGAAGTTVYMTRDADGNPVFSDQGSDGSQEVKVQDPVTFPAEVFKQDEQAIDYQNMKSEEEAPQPPAYASLSIISPADQDVIRDNSGNLTVNTDLPKQISSQHQVRLLMDGKVAALYDGSDFRLENIDRGTHSLQLEIVDKKSGSVLMSSPSISFSILRYSTQIRKPGPH